MKFLVKEKTENRSFSLIYNEEEYSFDIEPFESGHNFTSLSVNFLQLGFDYDKRLTYVWGYEPLMRYKETENFPQFYENKDLIAVLDKEPIPGIAISIVENSIWPDSSEWPIYINKKIGWVCVGDPTVAGRRMVEFAPNCVAALDEEEIVAVWLHPKKLPSRVLES